MVQLTPPGFSADGNWFWDGREWQDAISPDSKWRFDGKDWKRYRGQRTAMPVAPLYVASPSAPAPAVAPIEMPSWVAPSEVERIVKEKQEQAAYAAVPRIPPPPELDWRKAGRYIEHSKDERDYKDWQVGSTSVLYVLISFFVCYPVAFILIWRSGWRFPMKVVGTIAALVGPAVFYATLLAAGISPQDLRR
jgi:hypothetical protein